MKSSRIKIILILQIFFAGLTSTCRSQDTLAVDTIVSPAKQTYNIKQFVHETGLYVKQPLLWKGKDWLTIGVVAAGTVLFMELDKPIRNSTQGAQHYFYSVPVVFGRMYGEWYSIGGVAAIFGGVGIAADNTKAKVIAIELVQAGVYSEALTAVLKSIIGRERPYHNAGAVFNYHPLSIFDYNYHSLPSGHATSAVALSTVISRTASRPFFKVLAFVPAGFTIFSRIYQDRHFASDEFLGAAIGFFVGNWVVDLHSEKKHRVIVTSINPPGISISFN